MRKILQGPTDEVETDAKSHHAKFIMYHAIVAPVFWISTVAGTSACRARLPSPVQFGVNLLIDVVPSLL
jgi:hypothetical protein